MNFFEYQNSAAAGLLRLLPPVLRARGFYLYLEGGRRITDLWQAGGRAILGHKPSRVVTELKNASERGLFAALPHPAENRFFKALRLLFPSRNDEPGRFFRVYADKYSLFKALEKAGYLPGEIMDPAFFHGEEHKKTGGASIWRPFLPEQPDASLLLPILPWAFAPLMLAMDKSLDERFPPGDLLSPVALASGARAVYDLLAAGERGSRPRFLKIEKTLASSKKWRLRGIYLTPAAEARKDWPSQWNRFFEQGFLLPPAPEEPLILPGILSPGEEARLASLLAD